MIHKTNIIKSIMSKLVKFNNTFTVRKRIPLNEVNGITLSKKNTSEEFIIHVKNKHDYRYKTEKKILIIKAIIDVYKKLTGQKMAFYFRDSLTLVDYSTTKMHLKAKINHKPNDDPTLLDSDQIEEYSLPKVKFELVYSFKGKELSIDKFEQWTSSEFNPDFQYYSLTTVDKNFD